MNSFPSPCDSSRSFFLKAQPVWKKGTSSTLNSICLFSCEFHGKNGLKLVITACNEYRVFLNGSFLGFGPARASHGYSRVDEYELKNLQETNLLVVEAAAYNTASYCTLDEPGFLQAEVRGEEGNVIVYTGKDFLVRTYQERIRKVNRYSFQRAFSEAYRFDKNPTFDSVDFSKMEEPEIVTGHQLQERIVSYPTYPHYQAVQIESGLAHYEPRPIGADPWLQSPMFAHFKDEELEEDPFRYGLSLTYELGNQKEELQKGEFSTYQLNVAKTGFIRLSFECLEEADVVIFYDEIDLSLGQEKMVKLGFHRIGWLNAIEYHVQPGKFEYTSFEPYSAKYLRVVVKSGLIRDIDVSIVGYENPDTGRFVFRSSHPEVDKIVEAARNNFVANAVDLLTDCPSRERAGWLCDSYFTAKGEKLLTGKNLVESAFLQNYLHTPGGLPQGMIPMCYPADNYDGAFIPNWAMFFVIEVADQARRSGSKKDADLLRPIVEGVLDYFVPLENEIGLLEDLKSWIFVEWSMANDKEFIKGVNIPSNMMYAYALSEAGKTYDREDWVKKANRIKDAIRAHAFHDGFFCDNLVREEGKLIATDHFSESCQYYAFFTGTACPKCYGDLFDVLVRDFGAKRDDKKVYPHVYKSNAFIGNFLRLIMLKDNGKKEMLNEECIAYFAKMADLTGTLWEMDSVFGSLNHGFASFAANLLVDFMTGFQGVAGKKILFSSPCTEEDCHIEIPLEDDLLIYHRENGNVTISCPKGYEMERK